MGVPKRLTEMQKRFAEFIIFGGVDGPVSQGEEQFIKSKTLIDIIDNIERLVRALRKYIIRK